MNSDPYFQDILSKLGAELDAHLFEECAADVVGGDFPGTVHVIGGRDSGMDGGVPDGKGQPYPLVVTTSPNVIGNLTKSLKSYRGDGGPRRKAIVATSQKLTPKRRSNLGKRAKKLGFELVQTYEQRNLAALLYRRPEWTKRLLGLTGLPSVLCIVPSGARRSVTADAVGNDRFSEAIRQLKCDRLVLGPPGIGKTTTMYAWAVKGVGLFLESDDLGEIANALRKQRPTVVFVDDAHDRVEVLRQLIRIRREVLGDFYIVASTWPSFRDKVADALEVNREQISELKRLARTEIARLVERTGIDHPRVVAEIVNQSDGLPGLAGTLCDSVLAGDFQVVADGKKLSDYLITRISSQIDQNSQQILAAIAIGGDSGVDLSHVATFLQLSCADAQRLLTNLSSAGVIHDAGDNRLTVRPPRLRGALVRDVFYCGSLAMAQSPSYLDHLNPHDYVLELIHARALGAKITDTKLKSLISELQTRMHCTKLWNAYAYLGEKQAEFVAVNSGGSIVPFIRPVLRFAPHMAIERLLKLAKGDFRSLHATPEHPIRLLEDWIKSSPIQKSKCSRRAALIDGVAKYATANGDPQVVCEALRVAYWPGHQRTEPDLSSDSYKIIVSGIPIPQVEQLAQLWPLAMRTLRALRMIRWPTLFELLRPWIYTGLAAPNAQPALRQEMKQFATTILADFFELAAEHPGALNRLNQYAKALDVKPMAVSDDVFNVVYTTDEQAIWEHMDEHLVRLREVASCLRGQSVSKVASVVQGLLNTATDVGLGVNRSFLSFCECVTELFNDPIPLLHQLLENEADPNIVVVAARKSLADGKDLDEIIDGMLANEKYQFLATELSLRYSRSDELVDKAMTFAAKCPTLISAGVLRNELPVRVVRRLLRHDDAKLVSEVASSLAYSFESKECEDYADLKDDLDVAIIRTASLDEPSYQITQRLLGEKELAYRWCLAFAQIKQYRYVSEHDQNARKVFATLTKYQRTSLLRELDSDFASTGAIQLLVRDDPKLYRELLDRGDLESHHLPALESVFFEGSWDCIVAEASDAGFMALEIARSMWPSHWSWSGDISAMYQGWREKVEPFVEHRHAGVASVASILLKQIDECQSTQVDREEREAVFGSTHSS